jgi:hypothetical protein
MRITVAVFLAMIINSHRVDLVEQEAFSNSTTIVKHHRMKRYLIFQPGTRIMVRRRTEILQQVTRRFHFAATK